MLQSVYQAKIISLDYYPDVSASFSCLCELDGAVWLDSCAQKTEDRYDIISARPYQLLSHHHGITTLKTDAGIETLNETPFVALKKYMPKAPDNAPSLPFVNGAIGYIAYDYGMSLENIVASDKPGLLLPDFHFAFYHWGIVVDHQKKEATLCYIDTVKTRLIVNDIAKAWKSQFRINRRFTLISSFRPNISKEAYFESFDRIKNHLYAGDCYQVNLSHSFTADYQGESYAAYCYLRDINPVPYAAFMRLPQADILSFSPELFVSAEGSHVITKPIKGTIARQVDTARDAMAMRTLLQSAKDRAENSMIVDLLRNDLSKVCKPYSVKVPSLCALESFASVHHLVSTVTGELTPGVTHFELMRTLFPGGSITGAPKHETMKIIDQLEASKRGIYCGAIGYFSSHNTSCFNIAIRTMISLQERLYCYAGGGIVLDSEKEKEYQETLDKISILTEALGRCNETIDLSRISACFA